MPVFSQIILQFNVPPVFLIEAQIYINCQHRESRKKHHAGIEKIEKNKAVQTTRNTNQYPVTFSDHIIIHSGLFQPLFEMQIKFCIFFS